MNILYMQRIYSLSSLKFIHHYISISLFLFTFLKLCIATFTWCKINKQLLMHSTNDS